MRLYKHYLRPLLRAKILKTIWFNWKMFPPKQAWKLPVYLYGKTIFRSLKGKIILDTESISSGMIKIGKKDYYVATSVPQTIWTINGQLVFKGRINFLQGTYVLVSKSGMLTFGTKGTIIGSDSHIMCFDRITIGNNVRITWQVQLMDTSFHYIENKEENSEVRPLTAPIEIGDNVWIGNRTTISKGTILPSNVIVASNSLANKDYSYVSANSLLAGTPAIQKLGGGKTYL